MITEGVPRSDVPTFSVASTNASQAIAAAKLWGDGVDHSEDPQPPNNLRVKALYITCETNSIRYTFKVDASQSLGHVLTAGTAIRLASWGEINAFRFASAAADTPGTLMITPYF